MDAVRIQFEKYDKIAEESFFVKKGKIVNVVGLTIESAGTTIGELFREREPLYRKHADITVDCSGLSPEECVEKIVELIKI